MSSEVCATCRTTPISQSALDKNPMPRHLFEGNPEGEITIRRGTDTPVRRPDSGPSSSCVWNPRVFADDARGWQCPFVLCLHSQGFLRRGVWASGSYQERTGKSGLFVQPMELQRVGHD